MKGALVPVSMSTTHACAWPSGTATAVTAAEASLPAFIKAFSTLEEKRGTISDKIQAEAERINAEAAAVTTRCSRPLWIGAAGSLALLGVLAFTVTRSIPRPFIAIINRLRHAAETNVSSAGQVSQSSATLADGASR